MCLLSPPKYYLKKIIKKKCKIFFKKQQPKLSWEKVLENEEKVFENEENVLENEENGP